LKNCSILARCFIYWSEKVISSWTFNFSIISNLPFSIRT